MKRNVRNNLDIHCYNYLAQNVIHPNFFHDSGKLLDVVLKMVHLYRVALLAHVGLL